MYQPLIHQMMQSLRGILSTEELLPFVLQLIAWSRLSKLGTLSSELALNEHDLPRSSSHVSDIFKQISESNALGTNSVAFSYINPTIQHLSAGQLLQALELLANSNLDEPWRTDDLINFINEESSRTLISLPIEVTKLMVSLAQIKADDKVYLPFEQSFQLTACAQNSSRQTYSETQMATAWPWLINLLCDLNAVIAVGSSLEKPSFLQEGRLTQFPVCVSFPPFNVRYNPALAEADRFDRFPEATKSGSVLTIRHLLARTKGRIVVAMPNNILFSSGVERVLRDDLLAKQYIETIVALPPALLSGTAIQFSLLILRTDYKCSDILFVDGCNEALYRKDGRNKATLTGWNLIVEAVTNRETGPFSQVVSVSDVIANDAQLQVSRYCKSSNDEALDQLLVQYPSKQLKELVTFVRPIPLLNQGGNVSAYEFVPSDFPDYGYATKPSREIKLTEASVSRGSRSFLRPLDIAIAIKGSVGKVAIMPPNLPDEANNKWVVGQSCVVLRIDEKITTKVDQRLLFSFLKSDAGQMQLKNIALGAAAPVIQLRELEKVKIPLLDDSMAAVIIDSLEKINEIEKSIADYRIQQQQLSKSIWNITLV